MQRKKLGVWPKSNFHTFPKLFKALQGAFPINFEPREYGDLNGLDGLILFCYDEKELNKITSIDLRSFLVLANKLFTNNNDFIVDFSTTSLLDKRLHGITMHDERVKFFSFIPVIQGDFVLASCNGDAIWLSRKKGKAYIDIVSIMPEDLGENECLWDQLRRGRFISLLPLVHFLREITKEYAWTFPPLRASVIIDDPNLHWPSYGYIHYSKLAEHAEKYNYHCAIAMIPFDTWFTHPKAIRIFKEKANYLSLVMHGIYHAASELAKSFSMTEAIEYLSKGLRLIEKFEKKYNLSVSRVMIAPHGRVSQLMVRAMLLTGYSGICISGKPYPWLIRPPSNRLLAGWDIVELVEGGFPVLPRDSLPLCYNENRFCEDIVLKAFLNKPIIFVSHHQDFEKGLSIMADVANWVNSIDKVRWTSLNEIIHSNFIKRVENNVLKVRLYSRFVNLVIPEGIEWVYIEKAPFPDGNDDEIIFCSEYETEKVVSDKGSVFFRVSKSRFINVYLIHPQAVDPFQVSNSFGHPGAILRRFICEMRDRSLPLLKY